jgi:hypothetical protein
MSAHSGLKIPHDQEFVRVQFPCMPAPSAMNRIGGVASLVRATAAAEDDALEDQVVKFQMSDAMVGPELRSKRDKSEARLLLRVHTNADGQSTPSIMGVVRTAFSFDSLGDYAFDGAVTIADRAYPADDRRDFLNSNVEPLVLVPSWPLAGSSEPSPFNLSGPSRPKARSGDAPSDFSSVSTLTANDPQPQPPAVDASVLESDCYKRLHEMFQARPVWQPTSLQARFDATLFNTTHYQTALAAIAYRFSGGPFRRSLVRYGYDPRVDPHAARYQCIDLRLRDEAASLMSQYAANIKASEERAMRAEEETILLAVRHEFHIALSPSEPGNPAEDVNFIAVAQGVPVEQVRKAEAYRRHRLAGAKRRLAQKMALEQVMFVQAPTRTFTMVALEDLQTSDAKVKALLDSIEPTSKYDTRLGWIPQAIHTQITTHLKRRAEEIMAGDVDPAAVNAVRNSAGRFESGSIVPDNYPVIRRDRESVADSKTKS